MAHAALQILDRLGSCLHIYHSDPFDRSYQYVSLLEIVVKYMKGVKFEEGNI